MEQEQYGAVVQLAAPVQQSWLDFIEFDWIGWIFFPNLVYISNYYYFSTLIKTRVGDDGVPVILQYRPSDLYLTDRKKTKAILQKDTHMPLHICK